MLSCDASDGVFGMEIGQLKPNIIVSGPVLPEPVLVITTVPVGSAVKLVGKGLNTGQLYERILESKQLDRLDKNKKKITKV